MLFNKATVFTAVAALSQLAFAQEETPEGQTKIHIVKVGDASGTALKFDPEEITAKPGEMVQFQFWPRNHSVAQSTFDKPCVPLPEDKGFWSGFMPVAESDTEMPTFTIPVKDDKPIWFFCATGPHCQRGMAGVINPPANNADRTLAKYKEAAAKSTTELPEDAGDDFGGEEGELPKNGTAPTGGASPTGSNPPGSSNTNTPGDSTGAATSLHMSGLTVALGALAGAFFLA